MVQDERANTALELWSRLTKAHDAVRKAHVKQIATYKLTAPQFGVLEVLKTQGPVPLKRISEELLVTGANITCVVDNLEKEDLVRRVPSKEDRRIIMAELTEKGEQKFTEILPHYVDNMQNVTGVFSDDEKSELNRLLAKLANN
ncbi:MAG: MarR family winged helix-turn-helix transcriptional regulator [Melioribacteraceae bacterium]|nr:MarR family winged helix-turn-helix transcriptional regulator [Melioribacteraceae bacterium]MCF8354819.1 MarR family winged helix-turn-helix transcriptional regulator [Melioribacteraceae bacterium]MCF8394550.1 MarR family winged helix-turn-helix transcriptional regulator [Melioribacteraceae bacterium]MCF8420209.1 MarR family winged helix-turn-helix transcriptional regulator [Melioribacteraceae bacterium]